MGSSTEITVSQLSRLIGLPGSPVLFDVRTDDDFNEDQYLIPGSIRQDYASVSKWSSEYTGRQVVVVCQKGRKLSQGVAALLRHDGIAVETLEGGFEAWCATRQPVLRVDKLPARDEKGRTVWVTRARPKIDRIACPWLIRRFVDPRAVFLFVASSEVRDVAERFNAAPFDIDDVFWSHRGERCTFDVMIEEFGLDIPALQQLALIVRGADTARSDLAPEAPGLLAASLGFSRMYKDDLVQLEAAMSLYDAFYRWCRDARDETHDWPMASQKKGAL